MPEPAAQQSNPATYEIGNLSIQAVNTETLSGDKTLSDGDNMVQVLDAGGQARNVTLPADDLGTSMYWVVNTSSAAEDLTVQDSDSNTVVTVSQNESALLLNTGSGWVSLLGAAATDQDV